MAPGDKRPRKPPSGPYDLVKSFNDVISTRDEELFTPLKRLEEDIGTALTQGNAREKFKALPSSNEKDGATKEYFLQRKEVQRRENALGFDHHCTKEAEAWEVNANTVIQKFKELDVRDVYDKEARIEGYAGQKHKRIHGDRFLLNAPIIEKTRLYRAIQKMPKGAHLHIHFNANLLPHVLLDIAKGQKHMYIMSDTRLVSKEDFEQCSFKFSIFSDTAYDEIKENRTDLFSPVKFGPNLDNHPRHIMLYSDFRTKFLDRYIEAYPDNKSLRDIKAIRDEKGRERVIDEYLTRKIVFQPDEAYHPQQTAQR